MNWVDNALNGHATALSLRSQRSEILAGNIANADTPNYKARDFDFSREFRSQLNGLQGLKPAGAPNRQMMLPIDNPELLYRVPQHATEDGNTVEGEAEQSAFTKNAIQYQVSVQFLSSKIKGMKLALKGE